MIEIREGKALFIEGQLPSGPLLLGAVHGFDPDKVYTAQIALLRGTVSEVRSEPYRLELFHAFLTKTIGWHWELRVTRTTGWFA